MSDTPSRFDRLVARIRNLVSVVGGAYGLDMTMVPAETIEYCEYMLLRNIFGCIQGSSDERFDMWAPMIERLTEYGYDAADEYQSSSTDPGHPGYRSFEAFKEEIERIHADMPRDW